MMLSPVLILAVNNVLGLIKVKSILKVLVFNYQKSAVWFSSVQLILYQVNAKK